MTARNYNDTSPPTTLTADINSSVVSIPVVSTAGYPTPPFTGGMDRGTVNQEVVLVTAIADGTHFTVIRGYDGTSGTAHSASTGTFEHCSSAIDFVEANTHINDATRDDHTQYMKASGTRHDSTARHLVGTSIATGVPGSSFPGDSAVQGVSTSVAALDHQHARESVAALLSAIIPVGMIMPYAVPIDGLDDVPVGFVICNGQAISRSTYPALFTAIGVLYGPGDGSSTFNVPNMVERIIIGSLPPGTTLAPDVVGNVYNMGTYGGELYNLLTIANMPTHSHGVSDPTHNHAAGVGFDYAVVFDGGGTGLMGSPEIPINNVHYNTDSYTGITINATGGGTAFNIVSPYLTMHYLIKSDH